MSKFETVEELRLAEAAGRTRNWRRWGPYLSERQWATIRADYSPDGTNGTSFPYEHSLRRAYRWGEDGLLGITDRECRLCFAVAPTETPDAAWERLTRPAGRLWLRS